MLIGGIAACNVLVTGGAGFIGSHVVDRLVEMGNDVTVFDNLSSGRMEFIEHHLDNPKFTLIDGDLLKTSDIDAACKDIDLVFHIAANPDALYPEPVNLERAEMDFRLRLDPFSLHIGQVSITDQEKVLHLDGTLDAGAGGWALALNGEMDAISPERVVALWPQRIKPRTRNWIVENLHSASVHDIRLAYRTGMDVRQTVFLEFEFDEAEVTYARELPGLHGGAGHAPRHRRRNGRALRARPDAQGAARPPRGGATRVRVQPARDGAAVTPSRLFRMTRAPAGRPRTGRGAGARP